MAVAVLAACADSHVTNSLRQRMSIIALAVAGVAGGGKKPDDIRAGNHALHVTIFGGDR
jgi:hypothetical protein